MSAPRAADRIARPCDSTMLTRLTLVCMLALTASTAFAEKVPMDDEQLRSVSAKGIVIAVNLQLNTASIAGTAAPTNVAAGFAVNGVTTYAIVQNFGGGLQMFAVTIDPSFKPDGTGYLAIGLPAYLSAQDFGAHALGVQTDATVPLANSLGSLTLNGTASMTGQLNLWAK